MATRQHVNGAARAAAGQDGGCMGAHILVVDDDPLLAAALRRPLAYEGFEVEVAAWPETDDPVRPRERTSARIVQVGRRPDRRSVLLKGTNAPTGGRRAHR